MALRSAVATGGATRGGTAWVSLEPCAHHGRTPPCADALVAAGLARVVVATSDPFARVAGQGVQRLRAAGIDVVLAEHHDDDQARAITLGAKRLNIGFFSRVLRGRPWVRVKVAASLDGRTALANGVSQWITGAAARTDGHQWRKRAGAVLTGIGTVRTDDPRLDVRLVPTDRQPTRVVLDSTLSISARARILQPPGEVVVVCAAASSNEVHRLQSQGVRVWKLPGDDGQVDLAALLYRLAADAEINELHVEAGATLNGALLTANLADELLLYLAPKVLGSGRSIANIAALAAIPDQPLMQFIECLQIGSDMRLRAIFEGADGFF